jgi:hypothetical protein
MYRSLVIAAALLLYASTGSAATYVWFSKTGGDWDNPANWIPPGYPQLPGDNAVFTDIGLGNTVIDINIPNGHSVTCGVLAVLEATNTYRFTQFGTLVMTNDNAAEPCQILLGRGNMPGASWPGVVFQQFTLQLDQSLLITNGGGSSFYALLNGQNMVGSQDIEALGRIEIGRANPDFTGRLILNNQTSYSRQYGGETDLYVNATIVCAGGGFNNNGAGNPYNVMADMVISNTEFRACNGSNLRRTVGGDITVAGGWSCTTDNSASNSVCTYTGDVSGEGTASFSSQLRQSNVFIGSISPGTSVGTLTFVETSQMLYSLGTAADPLELRIEIAGTNGVPGVDNDLFIVSNHHRSLWLDTLDLRISGIDNPAVTSWFLYVTGTNIEEGTELNNVRYQPGLGGVLQYDYANNRVGIVVVPEPAAAAAVCALLVAARRMKLRG